MDRKSLDSSHISNLSDSRDVDANVYMLFLEFGPRHRYPHGMAQPTSPLKPPALIFPRFTIDDVSPTVESGKLPAKGAVGEVIPFSATAFREGHEYLSVDISFTDPNDLTHGPFPMTSDTDPDRYSVLFRPHTAGLWTYSISAWSDPWETWLHRAHIKIPAGIDIELELAEGAAILERISFDIPPDMKRILTSALATMRNTDLPASVRFAASVDHQISAIIGQYPLKEFPTASGPWPLLVERTRALVGAWYEFFPRSEGAVPNTHTSGTFTTAAARLSGIADMGFDVVYLPPIHPIGRINRKGRNNSLTPDEHDPGSPWAIGSEEGGHDCLHPELGSLQDFAAFVTKAASLGLEVAIDLALQAAPDHPWVAAHPEWFTTRADGTIAFAENPPKKYQDIYPLNFDNDPEGLYREILRIVTLWISRGIKIFRVDNPHTKPVWVWHRLIQEINRTEPDVIFLAEAFTRAPMMRRLAEVGFQQSYTYFTWKNSKDELVDYFTQLAGPMSSYMRPNVFTNTPDILHAFLQSGHPAAFAIRATLAATLSPTYGIYSGFELYEHVALRPGSEEYLDSEKFQFRPRDWQLAAKQGRTLAPYITRLNDIRRRNSALQSLRSLRFHPTDSPDVIAYSKRDGDNVVLVVCNIDPYTEHMATVYWNMPEIGLDWDSEFAITDHISGNSWRWNSHTFVKLNPYEHVAHIATITSPVRRQVTYEGDHNV